jgi:hypothetical protein
MSLTRIDQIEIFDFRGFPRELVPPIKLDGKNLLIHGENGSDLPAFVHGVRSTIWASHVPKSSM